MLKKIFKNYFGELGLINTLTDDIVSFTKKIIPYKIEPK